MKNYIQEKVAAALTKTSKIAVKIAINFASLLVISVATLKQTGDYASLGKV
ncbi:MAG: hypothetical protein ACLKAL_09285 [Alkaliphilus sp.]